MAVQVEELSWLHSSTPGSGVADRAFEETYARYRARILRFCCSRLGDVHEAEDVTQETFARAWKADLALSDQDRCYAWLRVVAGNLCTDQLRRRGRCQPAADIEPGTVSGADDEVMTAGDVHLVRLALDRLNTRHRDALEQRESAGWTYEQMAEHAGTSISSIESLLWRARQALKREFNAVAGPNGALAGVPVLGLLVRKFHSGRQRMATWVANWIAPPLTSGTAVMASMVGSCVAVCAAAFVGAHAAAVPPRLSTVAVSTPAAATAPSPVAPPVPAAAATAAAVGAPAASSPAAAPADGTNRAGTDNRLHLQSPVATTAADTQRDQAMPVSAAVGDVSVGVDPNAVVGFVTGMPDRPILHGTGVLP